MPTKTTTNEAAETPVATDEPILPNWRSQQFRDGVFVGAATVLLSIFLWSFMAASHTTDAACDRAYRDGWMQAFREWSDCLRVSFPAIVAQADIDRMERRRKEMESYDKQT